MEVNRNFINKSIEFKNSEIKQSYENLIMNKKNENNDNFNNVSIKEEDLKKAIDKVNNCLDNNIHIEYEKHDKLNAMVIKLVDNDTKEVIKEIPSKRILDMVAKLCELAGVLVDQKA